MRDQQNQTTSSRQRVPLYDDFLQHELKARNSVDPTTSFLNENQDMNLKNDKKQQLKLMRQNSLEEQAVPLEQNTRGSRRRDQSFAHSIDAQSRMRPTLISDKNLSRLSFKKGKEYAHAVKPIKSNYESMSQSALN